MIWMAFLVVMLTIPKVCILSSGFTFSFVKKTRLCRVILKESASETETVHLNLSLPVPVG